jgi:hypothetical protein
MNQLMQMRKVGDTSSPSLEFQVYVGVFAILVSIDG